MRCLLLALLFVCSSTFAEEIDKSQGQVSNILVTIFWFDTLSELQEYIAEMDEEEVDDRLQGYSLIERYDDRDMCHMDMYAVVPNEVDGNHTLTIGHEVLHCVYGEDYHEEVE